MKDATAQRSPDEATIAVVVSTYNYGHYVGACLDSVLAQTAAPDEIIVVDDGSTDGTASVLARYQDKAQIVETANGGQAAAMNTGFAASTSDLVLFLDADDLLKPDAVATILAFWARGSAHLTFELETIDAAGRSLGVLPLSQGHRSRDNRPDLLREGTFGFPPTSGNVFAREALARILPLPTERWRVSADCYLIRAAALCGPTVHIPRVLGRYRLHGTNNYARDANGRPDSALDIANRIDVSDAIGDLAVARDLHNGPDGPWVAAALSRLAQSMREDLAHDRVLPQVLPQALPVALPGLDPDMFRARRLPLLEFGRLYTFESGQPVRDGLLTLPDGTATARAELDLRIPPHSGALLVRLGFMPPQNAEEQIISLFVDGEVVASGAFGTRSVNFSLRGQPWDRSRTIRIAAQAWSVAGEQAPPPQFAHVRIGPGETDAAFPHVPFMREAAAGWLLGHGRDAGPWRIEADGALRLCDTSGLLRFGVPTGGDATMIWSFAEPVASGRLTVKCDDRTAYAGRIGPSPRAALTLEPAGAERVILDVTFEPDDPGNTLAIATVELLPAEPPSENDRKAKPLALGQSVVFASSGGARDFLAEIGDWASTSERGARLLQPTGSLRFQTQSAATGGELAIALAPVLPPGQRRHIVGVSQGEEMLLTVELAGPGRITVPLGDLPAGHEMTLTLHSIFADADAEADPLPAPLDLLSMELFGTPAAVSEQPVREKLPLDPTLAVSHAALAENLPAFQRHLDTASALLVSDRKGSKTEVLVDLRGALAAQIATASPQLLLILSEEERLSGLDRLGAATQLHPAGAEVLGALQAARQKAAEPERLRAALLSILLLPAYKGTLDGSFDSIPAPLLKAPDPLAAYLGRAPHLENASDHRAYREWLLCYLDALNAALREGPEGDPAYPLARAGLECLNAVRTIFGDGNVRPVVRKLSRAIERALLDQGADLWPAPLPSPPGSSRTERTDDRLRVGVLVRDMKPNPEGWAVLGMYRALDRKRFSPILIRMDKATEAAGRGTPKGKTPGTRADDVFDEELVLTGLSVSQSVAAIRGLDLDVLVTGAYVFGWEKTSAVIAHRLAPLQVWHGAVCPTTGGFRAFDVALSCRATEPDTPERHYTEPLEWIDGPLQCTYPFDPTPAYDRSEIRRGLGIAEETVVFFSAAMAHKIQDELLGVWADILSRAPEAVLVLCPFAPNWSMAFAAAAFEARAAAAGLPPDRVVLVPTVRPERIRQIAGASDVSLDSFPYTGATTVCESLSQGTPVVTLAGDALRQLTGTSWVRAYGLEDLVARDAGSYADIAVRLATSPETLAECSARCREAAARTPHDDEPAFGSAFGEALLRLSFGRGLKAPDPHGDPSAARPRALFSPGGGGPVLRRPPLRRFAILAGPRTGSTLLCRLINAADGVICHYELFHEQMIKARDASVADRELMARRDADPAGFLAQVFDEAAAGGYIAAGFKVLGHEPSEVLNAIVEDPGIALISLHRENLLAQFASELAARHTGRWELTSRQNREATKVVFDPAAFETFLRFHDGLSAQRREALERNGRTCLALTYRALSDADTHRKLSELLDISIPDAPEIGLRRQGDPRILSRFANPEAVERYLEEHGMQDWSVSD